MASDKNIKEVYALINGQKCPAVYKSETDSWEVIGTAPSESSWSQADHVYPITLVAVDKAGNEARITNTDEVYGDELKLRVLEKTAPTATITSPTTGSVIGNNTVSISVDFSDAGGSGLNKSEVVIKVNDTPQSGIAFDNDGDPGSFTASVSVSGLSDGQNTITAYVKDNDGNVSNEDSVTFVISTVAPNLVVETPIENAITNLPAVEVKGYASAATDGVNITKVTIAINGAPEVIMPEDSEAASSASGYNAKGFKYTANLTLEGENTLVIVATDEAGKTTTVTRHIVLDTESPVITDVVLDPHIVDASGSFKITFKVTDSE